MIPSASMTKTPKGAGSKRAARAWGNGRFISFALGLELTAAPSSDSYTDYLFLFYLRGRIASRDARPSTGPEKRSAQRAGQRLRGEQSPAAGGRQRGV